MIPGALLVLAAAAVAVALAGWRGRRPRLPAVSSAPLDPVPSGAAVCLVVLLPCQGRCGGRTAHEDDGAGTATCISCDTPRPAAEPEED
jgi:hypothetical protein